MTDVLEMLDRRQRCAAPYKCEQCMTMDACAAEIRSLRARVAELESDHEWFSERCADCGHRFAYPSNYCPRCNEKVGPTEPDVYPELCECPRCIVARNVALDAARGASEATEEAKGDE
jgi:hypothetical protein